jgi:hypothetical protein
MLELAPLIEAVQRNCDIADARHAGDVTLCTYLLEMREHFRWERGLALDAEPAKAELAQWLTEREALWNDLAASDFCELPVAGRLHAPFEVAAINDALLPQGFVYGAGLGRFRRPQFFLAELVRSERHGELTVLVCGRERARDLAAMPAALQDGVIYVRQDALRRWLWQKIELWGMKRQPGALQSALEHYGYGADPEGGLERMARGETETLILHEIGEAGAGVLLGQAWREMLAAFSSRKLELLARACRDNLADCSVTLPALLERGNLGALHFFFANFDGMRRLLHPALERAYRRWRENGDDAILARAAAEGARHWEEVCGKLLAIAAAHPADAESALAAWAREDGRALAL